MSAILKMILRPHAGMYSEQRLRHLRAYQYQGVDKSFISRYILAPYWSWCVTLFPLWMAPNLITFLGLSFVVLALGVAYIYTPDLVGPGPAWIYFFFAFCLWMYSTLDNVDGKQARRTQSSSPLGELFDHGCDALNCTIGGLVQVAAMGLGSSYYSALAMFIALWAFYLPTWEEYHTGVLYLGYINGPTEGLLCAIGLMILSGIYGPQIWTRTFGQQFPILFGRSILENIPISHAAIFFFVSIFLSLYVPTCIIGVWGACRRRGTSFGRALTQLLPMTLVNLAAIAWLWSPHSRVRQDHFWLFWLAFALGFGKMATKIIYAHLVKRPFPYHSGLMLPLFGGALLVNAPAVMGRPLLTPTQEGLYLWAWLVIAAVGYLNWSYHLINSFCQYLGINCFSLTEAQLAALGIGGKSGRTTDKGGLAFKRDLLSKTMRKPGKSVPPISPQAVKSPRQRRPQLI